MEQKSENDENDTNAEEEDEELDTNEDNLVISDNSDNPSVGHVGRKPLSGPPCSLKTLINDKILEPKNGSLSIEYMGAKFMADLLPNGTIRLQETKQIFVSPSSWVNHCRKMINCDNKMGSAWSTIRYLGKRLDSYKLRWYRKQKKLATGKSDFEYPFNQMDLKFANNSKEVISSRESWSLEDKYGNKTLKDINVVEHNILGNRSNDRDLNVMVKCTPFSALERIQPFTITISTNALLLIDFHCHLTTSEVVGYLAGNWDIATHNLAILQAFPCRSKLMDRDNAALVEEEIKQALERRHLNLIGWYHSHPKAVSQPTIKDIESQMEYQIAMKGESDSSYTPCVGLICSPFYEYNDGLSATFQVYWVMPPPEYQPHEYGKPMQMTYTVSRDSFLTQDLLLEMRLLAHFYSGSPDFIKFSTDFKSKETYWQKLQVSLKSKLPRDLLELEGQSISQSQVQQQALSHFWAFIKGLLMP